MNRPNLSPLIQGASHSHIRLDWIRPDRNQPRKIFPEEDLGDLAESIRQRGMLHPIVVRHAAATNRFTIITGERRHRAAGMVPLSVVPCLILSGELTELEVLGLQLTENIQREDLKPVEEAEAFHRLMTLQSWNRAQLGNFLGISPSGITRRFALLTLSGAIQAEVQAGNLAPDTAYFISQLPDRAAQEDLAKRTMQEQLPRAAVAAEVRQGLGKPTGVKDAGGKLPRSKEKGAASKGDSPPTGQTRSPTIHIEYPAPPAPLPKGKQKLFNIDEPQSTVLVQTSAARLADADVFAILQAALLEAGKNRLDQAFGQEDSSPMQIVQELLTVFRTEEQALGVELAELLNLVSLLIVNKLGILLKNKQGIGEAAQRVLNHLSSATSQTIGLLLAEQAQKG